MSPPQRLKAVATEDDDLVIGIAVAALSDEARAKGVSMVTELPCSLDERAAGPVIHQQEVLHALTVAASMCPRVS